MNRYGLLIIFILLSSCIKHEPGSMIWPPEDPLAKSVFEEMLSKSSAKYTKDENDVYHAEPGFESQLLSISQKSWDIASRTSVVTPKSECQLNKFVSYLEDLKVIYVIEEAESGSNIKTTTKDFNEQKLVLYFGQSEVDCAS